MKSFFYCFLFTGLFINAQANPPEFSKKIEKEISAHFSTNELKLVELKDLSNSSDLFFKILSQNKEIGIAVLTEAVGRYDKFDYMLIYNSKYELELIKILVYRSDYGSEITAKRWLSQFYFKQENNVKYKTDIQAISGATFSATSLTMNVNRINRAIKEFKNKK